MSNCVRVYFPKIRACILLVLVLCDLDVLPSRGWSLITLSMNSGWAYDSHANEHGRNGRLSLTLRMSDVSTWLDSGYANFAGISRKRYYVLSMAPWQVVLQF